MPTLPLSLALFQMWTRSTHEPDAAVTEALLEAMQDPALDVLAHTTHPSLLWQALETTGHRNYRYYGTRTDAGMVDGAPLMEAREEERLAALLVSRGFSPFKEAFAAPPPGQLGFPEIRVPWMKAEANGQEAWVVWCLHRDDCPPLDDLMRQWRGHYTSQQSPLLRAVQTNRLALARRWLELGLSAHDLNDEGKNLLHHATSPDMVSLLCEYGVSPQAHKASQGVLETWLKQVSPQEVAKAMTRALQEAYGSEGVRQETLLAAARQGKVTALRTAAQKQPLSLDVLEQSLMGFAEGIEMDRGLPRTLATVLESLRRLPEGAEPAARAMTVWVVEGACKQYQKNSPRLKQQAKELAQLQAYPKAPLSDGTLEALVQAMVHTDTPLPGMLLALGHEVCRNPNDRLTLINAMAQTLDHMTRATHTRWDGEISGRASRWVPRSTLGVLAKPEVYGLNAYSGTTVTLASGTAWLLLVNAIAIHLSEQGMRPPSEQKAVEERLVHTWGPTLNEGAQRWQQDLQAQSEAVSTLVGHLEKYAPQWSARLLGQLLEAVLPSDTSAASSPRRPRL